MGLKKQPPNSFISSFFVLQALDAMETERLVEKEMKLSLKNSAVDTLLTIQAMEGMGWEFDPNQSREDQIIGLVIFKNTFTIKFD